MKLTKAQVVSRLKKLKEGESLVIGFLPCKANLNSEWIIASWLTIVSVEDFESAINEYTYYNCNSVVGNYPSYYLEEKGGN